MNVDRIKNFLNEPGERIGRYELIREIARGGMAVVFEAYDPTLHRRVALKVLKEESITRLRHEALAAARLRHPNIVTVHEVGRDFIAMDYVAGRTLAEALPGLPLDERLRVLDIVARAVHHAHGKGVIHRDLKPGNILLGPEGQVVLTDFGLAKIVRGDDARSVGVVVGTPPYMAPEQVRGQGTQAATDVWALGVLLYEILADRLPFEAETAVAAFDQIARRAPEPLPGPLGTVALKALEKDPARRYPSAAAFADDLARARSGQPVVARRPFSRRSRGLALAGLGVATVALAAALAVGRGVGRSQDQYAERLARRDRSEEEATRALLRDPGNVTLLLQRAQIREARATQLRLHGGNALPDLDAAEADLSRALEVAPASWEALFRRGVVRTQRGVYKLLNDVDPLSDLAAGEQDLLPAAASLPEARTWLGNNRYLRGRWKQKQGLDARADFEQADVDLTPAGDADRLMRRGRVRAYLRRFDAAEADFEASLRLAPADPWAWTWRGSARALAGDLSAAETHLDRAIAADATHTEAWEERGDVRSRRGHLEGAIADWNRAITLNPTLGAALRPRIQAARDRLRLGLHTPSRTP